VNSRHGAQNRSTPSCGKAIDWNIGNVENTTFVPVLAVVVNYGNAPFLRQVDSPDQDGAPNVLPQTPDKESDRIGASLAMRTIRFQKI